MRYAIKKPMWPYVLDVQSPQAQGLTGWYPGDPSGGGKLFDLSGFGKNGTITGTIPAGGVFTAGNDGGKGATLFNGSDSKILTPTLTCTSNFSVGCWTRPNAGNTTYNRVLETNYRSWFYLGANSNATQWAGLVNDSALAHILSGGTLAVGKWTLLLLVCSGTSIYLYVDGKLVSSGTTTAPATNNTMSIGYSVADGAYYFGTIEYVHLYNRALSAAEAWSLYAPATRWSLRYQLGKTRYFIGSSANTLVTYESAANSGYTAATTSFSGSASWSQSNRFLAVDVSMLGPGVTVSSMTYGGAACTLIGVKSTVTSFGRVECWGIKQSDSGAPDAGSNTLAVTLSGSVAFAITWTAYSGVHQTSPTEVFNSAQATNVGAADATVSVTTVAVNDWVHGALVTDDGSVTANQTSRNNVTGALGSGADEDTGPVASPGSTTISYTGVGALATWAIAGYAIRPTTASTLGNTGSMFLTF